MLVVQRTEREQIIIGRPGDVLTQPIVISVSKLKPSSVRIGVDAQRDLPVRRAEVIDSEAAVTQ